MPLGPSEDGDPPAASGGDGISFVAELADPLHAGRFSAKFAAHWEGDDGRRWADGPQGVSLDDALEWARSKADRVSVLFGGEERPYSGGKVPLTDGGHRPLPPGDFVVRPRPLGTPLDGREQVVQWRLHVVPAGDASNANLLHELARALRDDSEIAEVAVRQELVEVRISSGSSTSAVLTVDRAVDRWLSSLATKEQGVYFDTEEVGRWP